MKLTKTGFIVSIVLILVVLGIAALQTMEQQWFYKRERCGA
jgi:hypothetical protein